MRKLREALIIFLASSEKAEMGECCVALRLHSIVLLYYYTTLHLYFNAYP